MHHATNTKQIEVFEYRVLKEFWNSGKHIIEKLTSWNISWLKLGKKKKNWLRVFSHQKQVKQNIFRKKFAVLSLAQYLNVLDFQLHDNKLLCKHQVLSRTGQYIKTTIFVLFTLMQRVIAKFSVHLIYMVIMFHKDLLDLHYPL